MFLLPDSEHGTTLIKEPSEAPVVCRRAGQCSAGYVPVRPQHLFPKVTLCTPGPRGTGSASFCIHSNCVYYPHPRARRRPPLGPSRLTEAQMPFSFATPRAIAVFLALLAAIPPPSDYSTSVFVWQTIPPPPWVQGCPCGTGQAYVVISPPSP